MPDAKPYVDYKQNIQHKAQPIYVDGIADYKQKLEEKRDRLNNELIEIAIAMADLGRKLYDAKEELRVVKIKILKSLA